MKKTKLLSLALLLITFCSMSNSILASKVWRVNNKSNYNGSTLWGDNLGGTPGYPVFKEVNDAVGFQPVGDFDTLHIEASPIIYGNAAITKKLVIIGSGYFITDNPYMSNFPYNSKISHVEFNQNSEGSQLIGVDIVYNGFSYHGTVFITVNNITVKRCRIENTIAFQTNLVDAYILQNYFNSTTSNALSGNGFSTFVPPSDLIFKNNILKSKLIWSNSSGQFPILECSNNVFDGPANQLILDFATSSFHDNIVKPTGAIVNINNNTNSNVLNATCTNNTQFPGTPGLVVAPAMSSVFISSTSTDGQYALNPTWATSNPGANGERGVFGGPPSTRYSLSGLPAIPVIYDISTNGVSQPGTGLPVMIKARTIK